MQMFRLRNLFNVALIQFLFRRQRASTDTYSRIVDHNSNNQSFIGRVDVVLATIAAFMETILAAAATSDSRTLSDG